MYVISTTVMIMITKLRVLCLVLVRWSILIGKNEVINDQPRGRVG